MKRVVRMVAVAVLVAAAGWGSYVSGRQETKMTGLMLDNVEALATGEEVWIVPLLTGRFIWFSKIIPLNRFQKGAPGTIYLLEQMKSGCSVTHLKERRCAKGTKSF